MGKEGQFTINIEHLADYEFNIKFDWDSAPDLLMDEPTPLGNRQGPNASRVLTAAVANCLSASLLYCVSKQDAAPSSVKTTATCETFRNEKGRLRVGGINVRITVSKDLEQSARLKRCLDLFEDYCVVTESIRDGIPVEVKVLSSDGEVLH